MAKGIKSTQTDLQICKAKIKAILAEYNCSVSSQDEYYGVLIIDNDTRETDSLP